MSNYNTATARFATTAWEEAMEAEYTSIMLSFEQAELVDTEMSEDAPVGYLRLVERGEDIRIGGYNRRAGKNSKVKGQYRPWQQH